MSRKTFIVLLGLLALVEVAILVNGRRPLRRSASTPAALERAAPVEGNTALYVEPEAGFTWLYSLVNNAKTSIELTMYELVDTTFSADLVQACQRGVKVSVVLDQSLEKTANTPAYNQLAAAGPNCKVAWSNKAFHATHQKTITVDNNTSVVMTFNTTSRYYADTRDLAYVDTDATDVPTIQTTFRTDFGVGAPDDPGPGAAHNLIWSPTSAQDDLVSFINDSKRTLLVENEELSAKPIVDALASACKRGVQVQLTMTDVSAAYHANYAALQAAGCGVHIGPNDNKALYIHAKAMVADLGTPSAVGYLGSIDFSDASLNRNRELGVYVHDTASLQKMSATLAADFARFPAYSATASKANIAVPARP